MLSPSWRNKLSSSVIIISVYCFVFTQAIHVTDRHMDVSVTLGRSNMLLAYCNQLKNPDVILCQLDLGH
jgi:hypothetical protein